MSSGPDTALINGHDLRGYVSAGVRVYGDMSSLLEGAGQLKGSNEDIPRAHGAEPIDLKLAPYTGQVELMVSGTTTGQRNANLAAFLSDLRNGSLSSLCTLERLKNYGAPDRVSGISPKGGQITGNAFARLNHRTGRTTLQVVQLSGYWLEGTSKVM